MANVETAVPSVLDRSFPPTMAGDIARRLEESGVVDYFQAWEQLVSWWPRSLWTPDVTPLAEVMPDSDSFADAFVLATCAALATDHIGLSLSTDAVRTAPAEKMQQLWTLAGATDGQVVLSIGAGENKQAQPFGHDRSTGIKKMSDLLQLFKLLWEEDDVFSFEGNHWTFDHAWIGGARPAKRPKIWALGGGPQLIKLATRYADGLSSATPAAFSTPEKYGAMVTEVKHQLEDLGRDPEDFTFALWAPVILHDDPDVVEQALDNPLNKFFAPMSRFDQSLWRTEEGLEPIYPDGWHYAVDMIPQTMSRDEAMAIIDKVPRKMVEKAFYVGSPKQIVEQYLPFIEAGASYVSVFDTVGFVLSPDQMEHQLDLQIEFCRLLKEA